MQTEPNDFVLPFFLTYQLDVDIQGHFANRVVGWPDIIPDTKLKFEFQINKHTFLVELKQQLLHIQNSNLTVHPVFSSVKPGDCAIVAYFSLLYAEFLCVK